MLPGLSYKQPRTSTSLHPLILRYKKVFLVPSLCVSCSRDCPAAQVGRINWIGKIPEVWWSQKLHPQSTQKHPLTHTHTNLPFLQFWDMGNLTQFSFIELSKKIYATSRVLQEEKKFPIKSKHTEIPYITQLHHVLVLPKVFRSISTIQGKVLYLLTNTNF